MATLSDYQRDILVRTILGEARGEGRKGLEAVAHTIRNRAESGRYPSDPAAVALQPSQYSVWNAGAGGGRTSYSPKSEQYQKAAQVIDAVFGGSSPDPTNGALFYHTPSVSPNWRNEVNRYGTTQIGNHIFYNGRPTPPAEVPNAVASALDVVPPRAVAPVTPTPLPASLAAQRNLQPLTPNTDAIYAGIYPQRNLTQAGEVSRTVQAAQYAQNRDLASALESSIANRAAPYSAGTTIGTVSTRPSVSRSSSFVAQDRAPIAPPYSAGTPVATIPTRQSVSPQSSFVERSPRIPYSAGTTVGTVSTRPQVSGAVSFAGQDRGAPTVTARDVARVPQSAGQAIATIPTQARLPALSPAAAPVRIPGPMNDIGTLPGWNEFQQEFGRPRTSIAPPVAPSAIPSVRLANADNERLVPGIYPMAPRFPVVQTPQVASALSVTPPRNIPVVPSVVAQRPITGFPTAMGQRPQLQTPRVTAATPPRRPSILSEALPSLAPAPLRVVVQATPAPDQPVNPWVRQSLSYSGGPVTAATGFGSDIRSPYSSNTSLSG